VARRAPPLSPSCHTEFMADDWRRIVATLADPVRRQVYAGIVLGVPIGLAQKKRDNAIAALEAAGLIVATTDDYAVIDSAFTDLLAASPAVTRTGIDRFVRDGRIEQYPVRADDRLALLGWARDRAFPDGGELTEQALNQRLAELTADVASLRRYLVDAGLVSRDADGRRYRMV
jgi:hypothetical protein